MVRVNTLAQYTVLVIVAAREATFSWNGVAMLRQSPKRRDEQNPGREMPVAHGNRQARPKAKDIASDTTVDVGVKKST
jgi:hypothetical protein